MTKKFNLPEDFRKEIFEKVFQRADDHRYNAKNRSDNGRFMDILTEDPEIGGQLAEYIEKSDIRHYIKDSILNQYAKIRKALPKSVDSILNAHCGTDTFHLLETKQQDRISFYRTDSDRLLVVACVNYLKWETAVRKLSLYIANLPPQASAIELWIIVFEHGNPINSADKEMTSKALSVLGIKTIWEA